VVASAPSLHAVTPAEKQTLPVWAGSVVLHGSDAAGFEAGGTRMDERLN
jgi:hypothetical protein